MNKYLMYVLIVAIIVLLLLGEIAILTKYGHASWYNRIGFVLQIIGFYGIGIGFVQKSDLLKNFSGIDDMTSPDPAKFIRGNFLFIAIISSLGGVSLGHRSSKSSLGLGYIGQFLVICMFPFLFLYFLVHLIVICPLAYIGYFFSSAFVESIAGSLDDTILTSASPGEQPQQMSIREVIASNPSATKSFLIGIPAALLAFIAKGIDIFFK